MDTITGYGYFPVRFMSYLGIVTALCGISYAIYLLIHHLTGKTPEGWTSIMVIILFLGGIQLLTLGIIGEYVWRGVDESRRRPLYLIKETIGLTCKD